MSSEIDVYVDAVPPALSAQSAWGDDCDAWLVVRGTATDDSGDAVAIVGSLLWSDSPEGDLEVAARRTAAASAPPWEISFPSSALPQAWARLSVAIDAADRAGNQKSLVVSEFRRDRTPSAAVKPCP